MKCNLCNKIFKGKSDIRHIKEFGVCISCCKGSHGDYDDQPIRRNKGGKRTRKATQKNKGR